MHVAERQRSRCIIRCCAECELTSCEQRRAAVSQRRERFLQEVCVFKAVDRQRRKEFSPNAGRMTMIVGSGASDHLVNGDVIPRLRGNMREYKKLMEAKVVVTAGNKGVSATATGTIWGFIIDQAGQRSPVYISAMIIPGFGSNVFSSGESTILKTGNPHVKFNSSISPPMKQHPEDNGLCSYKVLARFQGSCSKDTAEEASQEVGIKPPVVESTACSSRLVPATSAGKPAAHLQGRMQLNAVTFLEETPSLEDGTLPQGSVDSSSGATPYIVFGDATDEYPGVERSTSAGVAPDAPHQKAASTRFNSCIEEPFDSTHARGSSGQTPDLIIHG